MASSGFLIAIQAFRADGRPITRAEFVDPLCITADDPIEHIETDGGPWQSSLVYFPLSQISNFEHREDANTMLFDKLREVQQRAAAFLDRHDPSIFEGMRRAGMEVRIFIEVRMDQDQMELPIDASLVAACGRHHLPFFIMSNDVTAVEAVSAGAT